MKFNPVKRIGNGLVVLLLPVAVVVWMGFGCGRQPEARDTKPLIMTSVLPVAGLIEPLVQGWANVETVMTTGVNPHGYEVTAAEVKRLADARILVVVGLGLDDWAVTAAENIKDRHIPVVRFTDLVGVAGVAEGGSGGAGSEDGHEEDGHEHGHHHGGLRGPNPHLWLDLEVTIRFVEEVSKRLGWMFPDHQASLQVRSKKLIEQLGVLDNEYREKLAKAPVKEMVTFHNAFDRLAERYGLRVVGHLTEVELSPGGEVTAERMVGVIKSIEEFRLPVVYAEPQFPDQAVKSIQEQTGVAVLRLDPEGNSHKVGYRNYMEMMATNLKTLVDGQSRAGRTR